MSFNSTISANFNTEDYKEQLRKLLENRSKLDGKLSGFHNYQIPQPEQIQDKIKNRKQELENEALAQDIALKRVTLITLFWFLAIETFIIFIFSLLQATHWLNFKLEEWSFKLLLTATIFQITYMLQVAVNHLFPKK